MTVQPAVFLDLGTLDRDDIDLAPLRAAWPNWRFHAATARGERAARIGEAAIVVTNKVILDRERLAAAPHLRLVAIAATGVNNIDLAAARELDIAVTHVPGYSTPSVVQHCFALILALTTRLDECTAAVRAEAWQASPQFCLLDFPFREIAGKRLGIVGYGALGRAVAEVARAFGMEVLLAQRPGGAPQPGRLPLAELLPRVDILSLHCPLTEATRGLIGEAELGRMRSDALLINTARGGIVDEAALAGALRAGRLGGAGIDVLAQEPPLADSPLLAADIPHLIVTPHVAWASRESRQRLIVEVARNIRVWQAGERTNRVE